MSTTKRQIHIPDDLWRAVKVKAATDGTSATSVVTQAVTLMLASDHVEQFSSTSGAEVRFATGTPPTQDLERPTNQIVTAKAPPPDFNTRPFTPVPKTRKK